MFPAPSTSTTSRASAPPSPPCWRRSRPPRGRGAGPSAAAPPAAAEPAWDGPFDLAFIDALKPEYLGYLAALRPRLARGALVVADNVLWGGLAGGPRGAGGG